MNPVMTDRTKIPLANGVSFFTAATPAVAMIMILITFATDVHRYGRDGPGSLIPFKNMPCTPDGASAYLVLYASTGLTREQIAIARVVIVPLAPIP
jgi:hypothetical protein